ncbi:alkaline shock response membrane anchor protein AmaP [Loigolactobacillus backii]|uniref:Uncharacterized protein n=1 Tax=Loigolactobacillus backii TaxID=375175 RepID=A0A192GYM2_9LACO|nr:alkaline shock response membrane anchor protein AmaP [Loigolactobacillus backii]ANK61619.1 hypothetical protein AYR53_01890 [Loigolactobacillus backii]ANK69181.1 hypothetical protein AYR56_02820 [Loigolactobacillus backii]MDA5388357.1 alkaline shock response membrane anchor protein AmaP [Loigolactobacillus backii]MDA5390851.1 alkaline shock response membrane anchor protein AmaP [Loigolactobacillus backii]PIO82148.1 hypothetical protein BSQ39_00540 [Loigolactobacillus backii]
MRGRTKGALLLLSLLGILQTVWFTALIYPLPYLSNEIIQWQNTYDWVRWIGLILGIISGLIFLGLLLIALFRRQTTNQLTYQTDRGQLNINQKSVEKSVQYAVASKHNARNVSATVRLNKRKKTATALVEAVTSDTKNLVHESQQIEQTVSKTLSASLGVPVKKVTVNLKPAERGRGVRVV